MNLSIHSLIWGWPEPHFYSHRRFGLSIHSLIWGWPYIRSDLEWKYYLSIHSLIWGWPWYLLTLRNLLIFQFTASYEADRHLTRKRMLISSFNSQPHMRLTTTWPNYVLSWRSFNSQPHMRLTASDIFNRQKDYLSIHSLIWGWPLPIFTENANMRLSIHSLIWGWPQDCHEWMHYADLSIHSLIWGWPDKMEIHDLYQALSIHSLIWGWPAVIFRIPNDNFLSIHSLIWGWPAIYIDTDSIKTFQFTASYEADPLLARRFMTIKTFNSQPHMRLTAGSRKSWFYQCLSIHSLIWGWPIKSFENRSTSGLSIHSLIWGWPYREIHRKCRGGLSIHSLIWGWPIFPVFLFFMTSFFQFTASYEADHSTFYIFKYV